MGIFGKGLEQALLPIGQAVVVLLEALAAEMGAANPGLLALQVREEFKDQPISGESAHQIVARVRELAHPPTPPEPG